jgi:hypothetical protein
MGFAAGLTPASYEQFQTCRDLDKETACVSRQIPASLNGHATSGAAKYRSGGALISPCIGVGVVQARCRWPLNCDCLVRVRRANHIYESLVQVVGCTIAGKGNGAAFGHRFLKMVKDHVPHAESRSGRVCWSGLLVTCQRCRLRSAGG